MELEMLHLIIIFPSMKHPLLNKQQRNKIPYSTSNHSIGFSTIFLLSPKSGKRTPSKMPIATINSHKLHYTDFPPTASPPSSSAQTIILAHGLGSTQNFYFPVLPYLTAYRCIIFDNYGAARSPFTGQDTSIPSIAKDIVGLMEELKVDKAIIVGFSMCGMIPTYMAATHPDKVIAGICVGPVHPTEAAHGAFKSRIEAVTNGKLTISYFPGLFQLNSPFSLLFCLPRIPFFPINHSSSHLFNPPY